MKIQRIFPIPKRGVFQHLSPDELLLLADQCLGDIGLVVKIPKAMEKHHF
jgi:hypothetical protein